MDKQVDLQMPWVDPNSGLQLLFPINNEPIYIKIARSMCGDERQ